MYILLFFLALPLVVLFDLAKRDSSADCTTASTSEPYPFFILF